MSTQPQQNYGEYRKRETVNQGASMAQSHQYGAGNQQSQTRQRNNTVGNPMPNPANITNSYYTNPLNSSNYESATRPVYQQGAGVQAAANALQQHQDNKPGEYQGTYTSQIQSLIDQALNQPAFSYDEREDPIYRMYADTYKTQGGRALKGAAGEASAMTGGYGSSYAQQAGQEAYQGYMQELNKQATTLRDQAHDHYQMQREKDQQMLSMLQGEEDRLYGRYRDEVSDYQNELNYLYTMFSDMSQAEYQRYMNDSNAWQNDRAYWYQQAYDKQQQENWEKMFRAQYGR